MMLKLPALIVALTLPLAATHAYAASELNLAVSGDMASLDYSYGKDDVGGHWGAGGLYSDETHSVLAFVSFTAVGETAAVSGLQTGLGVKLVTHDTFQTAVSLALGGTARFAPEAWSGVGVEGGVYFAPGMLNTHDADQYFEAHARLSYSLHEQARVFVGYQNITIKYDDDLVDKVKLDGGINIGFTLVF